MQTPKKKMVYLVRHAQSKGNAGGLRGHASHPLSEAGEQQAAFIAERCAKLPIKRIVTSTMVRAEQTGDVIGAKLGITPTHSDLFIEALAPTFFHGKPADDPEILLIQQLIVQNFGVPGWRHSDE